MTARTPVAPPPTTIVRGFALFLVLLLLAGIPAPRAAWLTYGGNAQHTAVATVATQPLEQIHWQTPVDLAPLYSGTILYIHYGSPLVTPGNSVIFPVKVDSLKNFRVEARRAVDGSLLWQFPTDYLLPPHSWTPSVGPVITPGDRLYAPGAGGTVLWTNALDTEAPHTTTRVAFYGDAAYAANTAAFNTSLRICTPLTSDASGTVYFGVRSVAANPLGITSGIAAVDAAGNGRFVSATTATGGVSSQVLMNCAPALSADEQTLYVATRSGGSQPVYLLALATSDLTTRHLVQIFDPVTAAPSIVTNDGTASPMVAPDGKIFFGVLENPFGSNSYRGWLTQFDSTFVSSGAPGAFGWDFTPSIVPPSAVPSYAGGSPYLLMCKYNYYAGAGDGVNRIAVLDPRVSQLDTRSPATVMKEVLTIAGVTPDPEYLPDYPNAVREWCINTAMVDPFTHSVVAGSEDGILYRWSLDTNTFSESVVLTPGIGEAYTPTVAGPDGQVYAINNATLFAVGAANVAAVPTMDPTPHSAISLSPAWPNPMAGATRIDYRLTRESAVSLMILDVRGHLIRRLENGVRAAGPQSSAWDGRNEAGEPVAGGLYFYRLEAQGEVRTKRLVVER